MPEETPTPNSQGANDANLTPNLSNAPVTPDTSNAPTIPDASAAPDAPTASNAPTDTPAPMSSPIMNSKVHKPMNKLLPVAIILAVLTLAGIGTSVFAFIQNSNKDTEIARLRSELANQGVILPADPSDDNSSNDQSNNQTEIAPAIRAEVLSAVPGTLVLSDAKNLNTTYDMTYSIHDNFGTNSTDLAFGAALDLSTNQASLTLYWSKIKELYPNLNIVEPEAEEDKTKTITDLGLSGKPIDLLLTGFGQAVGDETLFFLMADGTVEYIPLAKATQENNFKSYGKLPNVANVIKFYSGSSCSKTGPGCGMQTLAQRADGNYYELYDATKITGNLDIQTD